MHLSNLMMSGIPGTNKTTFARGMAAHSALSGTAMEVIGLGRVKHTLRARLGYEPTAFQIFSEITRQAEIAGKAGRLVAFDAPNLTSRDRVRSLKALAPLVEGPWMLCQIHALPEQACQSYMAQRYKRRANERRRQHHLQKITRDFAALELARPHEGFDTIVHLDMNGDILTEAEAAAILYR